VAAWGPLEPASSRRSTSSASTAAWLRPDELTVLVADQDPAVCAEVAALDRVGVRATLCRDGAEALWQAGRVEPAVVVISVSLPVVPAAVVASVLCRLEAGPEAIVVGVGAGEAEQAGPVLSAGASRIVSRPYRAREIEALVRAPVARVEQRRRLAAVLTVGQLELDGPAFEARAGGRRLPLTLREFELLRLLMASAGGVVSQDAIRAQLWTARGETVTANTIAVHVRHLRQRLGDVATIVTVRGVGYRLAPTGA
jgi:DNA-binding response OmpR family regulator